MLKIKNLFDFGLVVSIKMSNFAAQKIKSIYNNLKPKTTMEDVILLTEFIERFKKGDFDNPSFETQINAGWTDWFCADSALRRKTEKLGNKVCQIADSNLFDKNKTCVIFKNCCPVVGCLYDMFKICDKAMGNVIYCVTNQNGKWQVYCENHWNKPIVEGRWFTIKKFFIANENTLFLINRK